jgi:hypothetical protein
MVKVKQRQFNNINKSFVSDGVEGLDCHLLAAG